MTVNKPEKLTDFPWLNIFKITWNNQGKSGEWIYTSRKNMPSVGTDMPRTDAVIIVPIHRNKHLIVIKEFRIPLGDYEYSFPAGLIGNESVVDCAKRELKEETGLDLTGIIQVSPPLYSSSGLSDESVVMVFCECDGEVSDKQREITEDISVLFLDIEQIGSLCNNHNVKQSCKLWPVLMLFKLLGTLEIKYVC
jgi:ADP-ribose pyrophosphatase